MVKLTIDLPADLAQWLAEQAATRGRSRQDLVIEAIQDRFERSERFDALLDKSLEENRDLLRRLAE